MVLVEVARYEPSQHARLFHAALRALTTGHIEQAGTERRGERPPPPFDLATFPEAFLPVDALQSLLQRYTSGAGPPGFVHVGLRADEHNHLLPIETVAALVGALRRDGVAQEDDLRELGVWIQDQPAGRMFNVGCLFGVDAERRLRICLHPKLVRSKVELSPLLENHMHEANLVSVVVLEPTGPDLQPLYIQPLLCSDALFLEVDQPACHPIRAVTSGAASFAGARVDHIDLVSVASCTPQSSDRYGNGDLRREWHGTFREAARRIAQEDDVRCHHGATMILANFREPPGPAAGGLSGVFVPHSLLSPSIHPFLQLSAFARSKCNGVFEDRWFPPRELESFGNWADIETRGYVAALAPAQAALSLLRFELTRLGSDARGWGRRTTLASISVRDGLMSGAQGGYTFVERGSR